MSNIIFPMMKEMKYSKIKLQLEENKNFIDYNLQNNLNNQTIAEIISLQELGSNTSKKNTILKRKAKKVIYENEKTDIAQKNISPARQKKNEQKKIVKKTIRKAKFVTSASFKTRNYSKKWNDLETEQFYQALQLYGTDFSIISQFFVGRTRDSIKNKFLKEEKINPGKIDKTLNFPIQLLSNQNDKIKQINDALTQQFSKNYLSSSEIFEKFCPSEYSTIFSKLPMKFSEQFFDIVNEEISSHNKIAQRLDFRF